MQPDPGDLRYNWVHVRLDAIDEQELLELVFDAWRVVPKRLAAASDDDLRLGQRRGPVLTLRRGVELRRCTFLEGIDEVGDSGLMGKVGDR